MMTTTPPSPRTPTSPISPISSTSPHTSVSTTPTSTTSMTGSIWTQSTTPPQKSFLSELDSPTIRSPSNRSLPSPSTDKSFADRVQGFQGTFEGPPIRPCDSTNGYKMTLSDDDLLYSDSGYAEYRAVTDEMEIDSPVVHGVRRNARDESLNSPILERILELLPRCLDSDTATHEQPSANTDNHARLTREVQEQTVLPRQSSTRAQSRTRTTSRTRSPHSSRTARSISRTRTESSSTRPLKNNPTTTTTTTPSSCIASRYKNKPQTTRSRSHPPSTIKLKIIPNNPQQSHLQKSISHLSTRLVPLISVTTGQPHPEFPLSLLQYHLLTHTQLDDLCRWYHQTIDGERERWMYPGVISRPWCFARSRHSGEDEGEGEGVDLMTKRRRFGKFIGLRGCESPTVGGEQREEGEEEMIRRMEREWRDAIRRAEEEERVREKVCRGRW